ncbi:AAA family ATPase [Acinetobacter sp. VNK23]|uniref:AAA family ATPase n=1 Tax=Acinetobacter corruptisaponis TaxID=3045147 RepID=A0ABY8S8Y7_9GAMM|nr:MULTISPECIES: AAA family ATPase [Acinetobacter]MDM1019875.1 AAA family ATPase [Acinetobacter thutiue]WHP07302.1 AAA family ATPase [Acinetobacter sp. KCTC 92772]
MKFINIIGTTGSGKSTLARKLAQKRQLHYIELDDLLWLDDWQESSNEALFSKLKTAMEDATSGWVLDGLYTRTVPMIMQQVDTVIWLDYPFHINLYRLTKRTLGRVISRKKLWENSNNRESLKLMLSKESIFVWLIKSYPKNRNKYFDLMHNSAYQHIQFIRLNSPKQTESFLKHVKAVQ